ncbi:MAG: hypothetical protein M9942_12445 [Microthrixaceae bacterium]|nr:hypothetical protein [Microthrixaceae bacterium]
MPPEPRSQPAERVPQPPTPQDEWIDEGSVQEPRRGGAGGAPARKRRSRAPRPEVVAPDLSRFVTSQRAKRLEGRVADAVRAYAAERYVDARRILKPIADEVPDSPEVRELYGLTLYRLGKWRQAAKELTAFADLTGGSVEQHPVLEDCYRALGRHGKVEELWDELKAVSPSAELMSEGRIVMAGSLADRGELHAAVALLSKGFKLPKRHAEHHLRRGYALADLYERAGDIPQARQIFDRIEELSPGYLDAAQRSAALG